MSQVAIKLVIDVVGALESGSMIGNIFALDTNRRGGSQGNGTDALQTAVSRGTKITWMIAPLECEAFVSLDGIVAEKAVIEPLRQQFPGSSISYWSGTVKRVPRPTSYDLVFTIGSFGKQMVHTARLGLIPTQMPSEKDEAQ
jgi:hypothetical protein